MPDTVAVSKQPVEIKVPEELHGKALFLSVAKGDARVDIVDDILGTHLVTPVYPGGQVRVTVGQTFFAVSKSDSKLTISPG